MPVSACRLRHFFLLNPLQHLAALVMPDGGRPPRALTGRSLIGGVGAWLALIPVRQAAALLGAPGQRCFLEAMRR
jgi:hypothetical protein